LKRKPPLEIQITLLAVMRLGLGGAGRFCSFAFACSDLRVGRQTANVQNVAQAIKTSIFFCAWAENKNIEAQACALAELMSVGGVMNCFG
jgi:hypothetical protein